MDTQALSAFLEVADTASFSKAAERLFLSQPAVSKRIATLEDQLGRQLFDRVGRQISLTDAGRALLPYARRVLHDIEDGRRALSMLSEKVEGRLSIGTSHHIGLHRLPPVLRAYTLAYPEVDLDIQFMDSEVACEAVLAGKLELGIVTLPSQSLPQLKSRLVWPDPLAVVVSPAHPLAAVNKPKLGDLAEHAAVLPDEATYTHRIVTAALTQHGLKPRIRLATNYLETLKMLVVIGLGWSVLPRSMLDKDLIALPIRELSLERELGVVWHEKRTLSAAATALIAQLPSL
ncbi:MAG: LysR family transcriptional regulator [Stagnimonas sp.]|nr:LysR family transcriptional regulator [Stagnimonas sp.]